MTLVDNWLDCSGFIEDPLLLSSVHDPLFDPQVVSTLILKNSVGWESRDNIEWSVNLETEVLIKSLGLFSCLISVDDSPFLVGIVGSLGNSYSGSFFILGAGNVQASIRLLNITEVFSLISEDLPPS
jgi:hypothetical protein